MMEEKGKRMLATHLKKKPKAMCIMADNTVTQIGKLCSMKSSFSSVSCFKHRVLNLDLCGLHKIPESLGIVCKLYVPVVNFLEITQFMQISKTVSVPQVG